MEKISKKDRESETMAMLTGFKGALFTARNPKAAKEKAEKEKGTNIFYISIYGSVTKIP